MNGPFRFIHAGDFHLESPPRGLNEIPDHLRSALADAPFRAAERVFDAATKERVDFLLLCGDIVDPLRCGPRALVFLAEQFQKLASRAIAVYWALGRVDNLDGVLADWHLPDNVHRFPFHRVERIVHRRNDEPLAQILGVSSTSRRRIRAADFHDDGGEPFSIGAAYGLADPEAFARHPVQYWALGGEHNRRTVMSTPTLAHYCGSPQGRRPHEAGPHGCTLVQVDDRIRTTFISTDAVRYHTERVAASETTSVDQLQHLLETRAAELLGDPFGPDLFIKWLVSPGKQLSQELRRGPASGEIVARLRAQYGHRRPAAWTVGVEVEREFAVPNERYEEETLLGEFLRTVRHYLEQADEPLDLQPWLAERHVAGSIGSAVALDDPEIRASVLREVAQLGLELLSPQEPRT